MRVLTEDMGDMEILQHIAEFYGSPENWEPYDKDYGARVVSRGAPAIMQAERYAKTGLEIIAKRRRTL